MHDLFNVDAAVLNGLDAGGKLDELAGGGFPVWRRGAPQRVSCAVSSELFSFGAGDGLACSRVSTSERRRRLGVSIRCRPLGHHHSSRLTKLLTRGC